MKHGKAICSMAGEAVVFELDNGLYALASDKPEVVRLHYTWLIWAKYDGCLDLSQLSNGKVQACKRVLDNYNKPLPDVNDETRQEMERFKPYEEELLKLAKEKGTIVFP